MPRDTLQTLHFGDRDFRADGSIKTSSLQMVVSDHLIEDLAWARAFAAEVEAVLRYRDGRDLDTNSDRGGDLTDEIHEHLTAENLQKKGWID